MNENFLGFQFAREEHNASFSNMLNAERYRQRIVQQVPFT